MDVRPSVAHRQSPFPDGGEEFAQGSELLGVLDSRLRAAEGHLLDPLDDAARQDFRSQLRLLATRLNALDPLDSPCELAEQVDAELPTAASAFPSIRRRR